MRVLYLVTNVQVVVSPDRTTFISFCSPPSSLVQVDVDTWRVSRATAGHWLQGSRSLKPSLTALINASWLPAKRLRCRTSNLRNDDGSELEGNEIDQIVLDPGNLDVVVLLSRIQRALVQKGLKFELQACMMIGPAGLKCSATSTLFGH